MTELFCCSQDDASFRDKLKGVSGVESGSCRSIQIHEGESNVCGHDGGGVVVVVLFVVRRRQ